MSGEELQTEVRNNVATITISRPGKRNSLTADILIQIKNTLDRWEAENSVRVVVFRGQGATSFSSGYDITAIPTDVTDETLSQMNGRNPVEFALEHISSFPYPTIAMMNGYAFGAGLNLAICCDIRIAADTISVGMPPAKLGLVYHPEGLKQFVNVTGLSKAKEIFFSGRTYKGQMVAEMGLADHLVPAEDLENTVYGLADEIAGNAPLALKGMKIIFNMLGKTGSLGLSEMGISESLILESFNSEDLKEGQSAFLEKRKPLFKGC